jgi:hypothetical protein
MSSPYTLNWQKKAHHQKVMGFRSQRLALRPQHDLPRLPITSTDFFPASRDGHAEDHGFKVFGLVNHFLLHEPLSAPGRVHLPISSNKCMMSLRTLDLVWGAFPTSSRQQRGSQVRAASPFFLPRGITFISHTLPPTKRRRVESRKIGSGWMVYLFFRMHCFV